MNWVIVVLAILAIGAVVAIIFGVRRYRYIKALKERGWHFDSTPPQSVANGLTIPPFGVGFRRKTDEHITGRTSAGIDFQVFEYQQVDDENVVCMKLPLPLPELVALGPGQRRSWLAAPRQSQLGNGGVVLSEDAEFAKDFTAMAGQSLEAFAARYPLSLAIDGDQLTQVGAPTKPDELEAYLELLAPIAATLHAGAGTLERYRQPPPPRYLGFYRRPTWSYLAQDDPALALVRHNQGGFNHRAMDVVRGEFYPGSEFIALEHHWQTQRTESSTDSEGRTTTRTVTDNHSEVIHEVALSFHTPELTITSDSRLRRLFSGPSIDFESAAFNSTFDVHCPVPKFAYDVLHPRQIEYLMAIRPQPFTMAAGRIHLNPGSHSPETLDAELAVLAGFLARIPEFVWQELQHGAPFRLDAEGRALIA
ncbi:MAG: hypothetical protein ACK5H2_13420 [Beutenbergiaceae bacterium]